ncbi:MAG: squalene synthase HpnC [Marmoricola sp.]
MGIEGVGARLGEGAHGDVVPTAPTATALRARERAENFPVALGILPRRERQELHAAYAFARTVDELGDSFAGDRAAQLHRVDDALDRAWVGRPTGDPVVDRLHHTGLTSLPVQPFHDLVQANLQDQEVSRYATYADLLGYCRLSADPVGRIVLGVFGCTDPATVELSDRVCTALQLLEHWQDVGEDRRAGRVYLPQQDLAAHRVGESELDRGAASPALCGLMRFEIDGAADLLASGAPVVGRLHGWARLCVAGFVAGGQATVAALRRTGGDVLGRPSRPSRPGTAVRLVRLAGWPGRGER